MKANKKEKKKKVKKGGAVASEVAVYSDYLSNVLYFVAVPPGKSVSRPHGFVDVAGRPLHPDAITISNESGFRVIADTTTITVTNVSDARCNTEVICTYQLTLGRFYDWLVTGAKAKAKRR